MYHKYEEAFASALLLQPINVLQAIDINESTSRLPERNMKKSLNYQRKSSMIEFIFGQFYLTVQSLSGEQSVLIKSFKQRVSDSLFNWAR